MSSTASLSSRQRQLMFVMAQVNKQWRRTLDKVLAPLGLTQALWLPLAHPTAFALTRKQVEGYQVSPFGRQDYSKVSLKP